MPASTTRPRGCSTRPTEPTHGAKSSSILEWRATGCRSPRTPSLRSSPPCDAIRNWCWPILHWEKRTPNAAGMRKPAPHTIKLSSWNLRIPNALRAAAAIQIRGKTAGNAVDHLKTLVRVAPRDPQAHVDLGVAYFATGDVDAAAARFREALRLKPDMPGALLGLGNVFEKWRGGARNRAAAEGRASRYEGIRAAFLLGTAYNRLGRYQDALVQLQGAVPARTNRRCTITWRARTADLAARRSALKPWPASRS